MPYEKEVCISLVIANRYTLLVRRVQPPLAQHSEISETYGLCNQIIDDIISQVAALFLANNSCKPLWIQEKRGRYPFPRKLIL